MKTVLFICTGNAGRSQLAQALFERMSPDTITVLSAGVDPWNDLHPQAKRLLTERGFHLEGRRPKHVKTMAAKPLDVVVTIGGPARDETPRIGNNPVRMHWEIDDPADADGTGNEASVFNHTCAAIEARLPALLDLVTARGERDELRFAPGISTCLFRPAGFAPATHLPMIAEAGFACIELCCFLGSRDFPWDSPPAIRELKEVAADTGVRISSVHAAAGLGPFRLGLSHAMALDMLKVHADLAAELGADVVPMHAAPQPDEDCQIAMRRLCWDLDDLADHARGLPCRFGWENEPKGITTADHLAWIRDLDPGSFGFLLDTGHAHMAGTTDAYLGTCGDLLCGLHLHDNDGTQDAHRIMGAGTIDWAGFRGRLESCGFEGPMMVEISGPEHRDDLPRVFHEARQALAKLLAEA